MNPRGWKPNCWATNGAPAKRPIRRWRGCSRILPNNSCAILPEKASGCYRRCGRLPRCCRMIDVQRVDFRSLPLGGLNLLEASAGTGKTFSIAGLYLRLVLGVGREPLPVESILVVSFTRAAVAELRGRIRQRLAEARQLFQRADSDDPFERFLLEQVP